MTSVFQQCEYCSDRATVILPVGNSIVPLCSRHAVHEQKIKEYPPVTENTENINDHITTVMSDDLQEEFANAVSAVDNTARLLYVVTAPENPEKISDIHVGLISRYDTPHADLQLLLDAALRCAMQIEDRDILDDVTKKFMIYITEKITGISFKDFISNVLGEVPEVPENEINDELNDSDATIIRHPFGKKEE